MLYPNAQLYHSIKTIFVHVPKTAGTSIERYLCMSNRIIVGGHTSAMAYQAKYPHYFSEYFTFAIVRDPIMRFRSAYRYLRQQPVNSVHSNHIIHSLPSIDAFIEHLLEHPYLLKKIVHILPQHEFVCDEDGRILVNSVFKYERLADAWICICQRIGIPWTPLARVNASPITGTKDAISTTMTAELLKLYMRDYEIFDYS
jgi:hypothetical protein